MKCFFSSGTKHKIGLQLRWVFWVCTRVSEPWCTAEFSTIRTNSNHIDNEAILSLLVFQLSNKRLSILHVLPLQLSKTWLDRMQMKQNSDAMLCVGLQTITHLKATQKLIYKKLYMIVCQLLSFDNITQVGTHQMCYKIAEKNHQSQDENMHTFYSFL